MKLLIFFSFVLLLFSFSIGAAPVLKTITVDQRGHGNFRTIQSAINSILRGNNKWIKIKIKEGVYREKVNIPIERGHVVLEGDGASRTTVDWSDFLPALEVYGDKVTESATFTISANNVVIKGLAFKNSYGSSQNTARAIAALIKGDKISFYSCNFIGIQDTVSDLYGRHYFKDCYIEGAVDFIFGMAQSLYEGCTLSTVPSKAIAGWVTAHGRASDRDPTGYVFKNCKLIGSAKTYLGRAWGPNARVIFYETDMADIVVREGWDYWNDHNKGVHTTYVEASCKGEGSDTSGRVPWKKTLSKKELWKLTNISFVDDGWLSQQAW